jgi:SAM-dependent methyltransferase
MELIDLIQRQTVPLPWSEGEKIPWNEPGFSWRMLAEHLSQAHDAASRRFEIIDQHVEWIHHTVLSGKPSKILDLGCGPGLYTSRLAERGHACVGIDFSPASISYAVEYAHEHQLPCSYTEQDIRLADFGEGFDLVMLIYGEINVFRPADARSILEKAHPALVDGGRLLLEVHTFDAVRAIGEQPVSWYSSESGLFSDQPHLCLIENFWDAGQNVATERYFILDALTGSLTRYAASTQAYTDEQYREKLEGSFAEREFWPTLSGAEDDTQSDFFVIVARKQEEP